MGETGMCTLCYVDDAMKRIIAAHRATFRNATESPFGSSDEIGMLNLITAESRDAIMSTADAGKMIDLSVDYFVGMPSWVRAKDPSYQLWMTRIPSARRSPTRPVSIPSSTTGCRILVLYLPTGLRVLEGKSYRKAAWPVTKRRSSTPQI
jgi:hypothetical protein